MAQTNGVNGTHANGSHLPALSASAEDFLNHKYDYIIVGGGTAGLVVAARLTENEDVTVGVLEAGKCRLDDPLVDTPAAFFGMFMNPEYDYGFMSEPQKDNNGKRHHVVRGKMLGGSSGINYMMYVRGSDQDYDDWAAITGDEGWSAKNMKQYQRKHQTLEPIEDTVTDRSTMPFVEKNHGTSGPCRTSFNPSQMPFDELFINACDEVTGLSRTVDPWSGDHIGFFNTLGTVARTGPNKGLRSYAGRGYFEANAHRPNLHVLCEATVSSVELTGDKATGVNFLYGGSQHTVKCDREVVVACGTIQSPQILELSGIGDPEVLSKAGIECKVENKGVGNNFADHPMTGAGFELSPGNVSGDIMHAPGVMEAAQKEFMETRSGPLTCITGMQGFFPYKMFASEEEQKEIIQSIEDSLPSLTPFQRKQYECTLAHLKDDKSANIQLVLLSTSVNWDGVTEDQSQLLKPPATPDTPHQVAVILCFEYALSRGSIHIKTSDPNDHPVIDHKFLSHPADAAIMGCGLKLADKVAHSKTLEGKLLGRVQPPPEVDLSDMKHGAKWAHELVLSEYHPIGTCAMGDVVDSRLRVHGVRGLRVIDGSVFPNHISGNMVSSVYMVAERGADLIKEDWDYAALSKVA